MNSALFFDVQRSAWISVAHPQAACSQVGLLCGLEGLPFVLQAS